MIAGGATPTQAAFSATPDTLPAFNGTVRAVAYAGNRLYVGGDFTSVTAKGRTQTRNRLAAIDARTGQLLNWTPAADGRVKALVVSGSSVYVAGDFATVGGQRRDSLARLDATTGAVSSTFRHSIGGRPFAVAAGNGRLYVGGTITSVDGQARGRLAAFNLTSGALDPAWKPAVDSQVEAITVASGRIYVGGRFGRVNNTSGYGRLVALEPATGRIVPGFKPNSRVNANAITVKGSQIYTANGGQGGTATAYSTSGALKWTATFDGDAQAVAVFGDTVYVGGHFDKACRTARTGIQGVCLDGNDARVKLVALSASTGNLRPWTADANGVQGVVTMAAGTGSIAVGGAFTTVNGAPVKRLAQFS
jgi:hypothetical protein